jgi:plasmid stabilization system protein ParE
MRTGLLAQGYVSGRAAGKSSGPRIANFDRGSSGQTADYDRGGTAMPRGDKSAYTDKQKRKAEHIEEGYEKRGVSEKEAERRAWATVNKESGGGNKSGSGRGKPDTTVSARKGGEKSGSSQSHATRSAAAKKGWETRRRNGD